MTNSNPGSSRERKPEVPPTESSRKNESNAFGVLHRNRLSIGLSYRKLTIIAFFSTLTGLGQAAVLLILVRLITALTADTESISGSVGPLTAVDLSTSQLLWLGLILILGLLVAETVLTRSLALLLATAQATAQRRMVDRYSEATFDAQTALSKGDTHAVLFSLTSQAGGIVGNLSLGISALANFVTLVASAILLSPLAAAAVLIGLALLFALIRPLNLLVRRYSRIKTNVWRDLSNQVLERLELSRELRSFGVEEPADQIVRDEIDKLRVAETHLRFTSRMSSVVYRVGTLLLVFGMVALIEMSGNRDLAALTGSLLMLLRSLSYGQALQASYQAVLEGVPVLEQLIEEEQRLRNCAESTRGSRPESDRIGSISLEGVHFAYDDNVEVLHGIDLLMQRGDFVALIGSSGAGKSTIMNLLLRLRDPTSGTIAVDGMPTSEIELSWWRRKVAHVPQEPLLQSGTVADAIRFHREGISDDDVLLAARRAHIADEVESWPAAYDTDVGQMGDQLSGGQRQRVAIARALVGSPDLLLLDEPTSALDPRSERMIAEALDEIRSDTIVVAIAHRLRTVERASQVILIDEGRVIPNPPHNLDALQEFLGDPQGN